MIASPNEIAANLQLILEMKAQWIGGDAAYSKRVPMKRPQQRATSRLARSRRRVHGGARRADVVVSDNCDATSIFLELLFFLVALFVALYLVAPPADAVLGSIEVKLISVNKNPTAVMLTWVAATNVHCATGKVVCKRSVLHTCSVHISTCIKNIKNIIYIVSIFSIHSSIHHVSTIFISNISTTFY